VKVNRLYRRQWEGSKEEILREICQLVGYKGKFVWLVETDSLVPRGPGNAKHSRIKYVQIKLEPRPSVEGIVKGEDGKITIDQSVIVVALPILDGRRRSAYMFMHPEVSKRYDWCKTTSMCVMPEELAVLMKETAGLSLQTTEVATVLCFTRGLITLTRELTEEGRALVSWYLSIRKLSRS